MTATQMIHEYVIEILVNDGTLPDFEDDPEAMKIAKLSDAHRKALKG